MISAMGYGLWAIRYSLRIAVPNQLATISQISPCYPASDWRLVTGD
jgi:hypothetical protein